MKARKSTTGLALALVLVSGGGWTGVARGQSAQNHGAHHPDAMPAQTAPAPAPNAPKQPGGMMPGMQGMGGDMQQMMQGMRARMAEQSMGGMMGMDHIEGRIAFLKAELAITDAQQPQWNAFADALRAQADRMRTMHAQMMQGAMPDAFPDRLTLMERRLSAHLEALKAIQEPARALYAVLSPDQQKKANELLAHPMGGPMGRM